MVATQIYGGLYVGDIQDVDSGDTSMFDRVISVCQDDRSDNVSCEYSHYCLADGPDQQGHNPGEYSYELLSQAIGEVISARIQRETVLVHCHMGRSRSATVAIAALAVLQGMSWDDAFEHAKNQRSIIDPGEQLIEDGKRYVTERQ